MSETIMRSGIEKLVAEGGLPDIRSDFRKGDADAAGLIGIVFIVFHFGTKVLEDVFLEILNSKTMFGGNLGGRCRDRGR